MSAEGWLMEAMDYRRVCLAGTHRLPACAEIGSPVDGRSQAPPSTPSHGLRDSPLNGHTHRLATPCPICLVMAYGKVFRI